MSYITVVQTLVDEGVDFVIIGGWAAIMHGSSTNISSVLEICYSRQRDNLKRLASALAPFHPRLRGAPMELPSLWDEVTLRNGTVFTLMTDRVPLDLLAEVTGVGDFETVKRSSIQVEAFGRKVWTLDLPGLIRAKRAAGREKDLQILPELEGLLDLDEPE